MITDPSSLFPELNLFNSNEVHDFALYCLNYVPRYFFYAPASSSGKYHPSYTCKEGGLVLHTRAAMNIFHSFAKAGANTWYQQDCNVINEAFIDAGLLALLIHDSFKSGSDKNYDPNDPAKSRTVHEHPLYASDFLLGALSNYLTEHTLSPETITIIESASNAILTHMGRWTVSKYSSLVLPSPEIGDWLCKLVHLADYLASRKMLEFNFKALEVTDNV